MFCVYCGTKNADGGSICVFCGQRVHNFQAQPEAAAADAPKASVTQAAPVQVTATVVVQRHSPESLPGRKSPSWLHTAIQKHPVAVFAAAVGILMLLPTFAMLWQWNANRLSRTHRLESLLKDAAELQEKSAEFTRRIQELRSRPTLAMKDYYDQCTQLEPYINDVTSATEKSRGLLEQVIPEFHDDAKTLTALNGMRKALELDQRLQNDVRQEVLLSKTLMHLQPSEQVEFYAMSIHPLQEEEKQLAVEEQQALTQMRDFSGKLPSAVSHSLLNQ